MLYTLFKPANRLSIILISHWLLEKLNGAPTLAVFYSHTGPSLPARFGLGRAQSGDPGSI